MKILNKEINVSNFHTTSITKKWNEAKFENKLLWIGFFAIGAIAFLNSKPTPEQIVERAPAPEAVDTYIPRGLVLIPLELVNAEALSSMIGDMGGVVDLYLSSNETRKGGVLIATRVKLVRAPRNPSQFAVLVRESEGQKILKQNGPFFAVVQNPEVRGAQLAEEKKNGIHIEYSN